MTELRPMQVRDSDAVHRLLVQLSQDLHHEYPSSPEQVQRQLEQMMQYGEIYGNYVYCVEDVVVGFISLVCYRTFLHNTGTALINELVVDRAYRNRNIGAALVDHAVAIAKDHCMDEVEVGVIRENIRAQEFYRRNGFTAQYVLLGREFS